MATSEIILCLCLLLFRVYAQSPLQCPPGCNPTPGANMCSWPTAEDCIFPSPSTPNPRAACACRAGYKATVPGILDTDTTKQWRLPASEGNFRVWVAEGVECNTLCDIWYGEFSCQEVVELPSDCLSNSISTIPPHLPIYSLGDPVAFPSAILRDILRSAAPNTTFNEINQNGSSYFYDGSRLAALYDNTTGQTSFWPKVESLAPASAIRFPFDHFSSYLSNPQIFPSDDTHFTSTEGSKLLGSVNSAGKNSSAAAREYLADIRIERNVSLSSGGYPVVGPGTKGFFSYGSDGNIKSFTHRWRPATMLNATFESIPSEKVNQNILDKLSATNLENATVTSVDFVFYDSGENFIQPAYRFVATLDGPEGATNISYIGYISAVSEPPEALPSLKLPVPQTSPIKPGTNKTNIPRLKSRQSSPVTVGRYPIDNSGTISTDCEADTDSFWSGLAIASIVDHFPFFNLPGFANEQYYWGDVIEYEGNQNSYINSVNLAFQCTHGNIHQFLPNGNEDWVNLADIGSEGGFGSAAGGSLSYWLIKACDVIPTITQYGNKYGDSDTHEAWDVWWDVFSGVHIIAGFSTEALVNDGIELPVSQTIGFGAGVAATWLQTIHQDHSYNSLKPYSDPNWGATYYGQPAVIFPCGHGDDTVFTRDNIGPAGCLTMLWY